MRDAIHVIMLRLLIARKRPAPEHVLTLTPNVRKTADILCTSRFQWSHLIVVPNGTEVAEVSSAADGDHQGHPRAASGRQRTSELEH